MSRPPHSSPPQDTVGIEGLESQRTECVAGLKSLSFGLAKCLRRPAPGSTEKAFFCRSDLKRLWTERPKASSTRPLDAVFHVLSETQRDVVFNRLLLLISFLVYVEISPDWFLECEAKLFKPTWHGRPTELVFEDTDGPLSEEQLEQGLALSPTQVLKWESQFMFRPARITLNEDDLDEWIQVVDRREPLPFELHRGGGADSSLVGNNSNSTGYHNEYGAVKLYRIASEYVSLIHQDSDGSENWALKHSPGPLRVVKTFVADHRALNVARDMNFLKQSLTMNRTRSIAIHDAIIGKDEGDHTRISIILPWASLGDLSQFLLDGDVQSQYHYDFKKNFPRVEKDQHLNRSLLKQSTQLAEALAFLHEGFDTKVDDWHVRCAHMDLRPANMIIFHSPDSTVGKWKISDFGISVFSAVPKIATQKAGEMGSLGDYLSRIQANFKTSQSLGRHLQTFQAPEIELPQQDPRTADAEKAELKSDIWSFGAILAEVLAYALGRSASVKDFRERRMQQTFGRDSPDDLFYSPGPIQDLSNCLLRPEVADWLDEFHHEIYPPPTTGCLKCWAMCVKSILVVSPDYRPNAAKVEQLLQKLQRHMANSEDRSCFEPDSPVHISPASTTPPPIPPYSIPFTVNPRLDSLTSYHGGIYAPSPEPHDMQPGSTRSPSVMLGSPTEASFETGTQSWQNAVLIPEVRRDSNTTSSSGIRESLPMLSASRSITSSQVNLAQADIIDFDLDAAGGRMAYLTRAGVEVFQLSPSEPTTPPRRHGEILHPVSKKKEWRGVCISGKYLVIWGFINRRPEVRIYNASGTTPVRIETSDDLPSFTYTKRVAVSRLGFIALIQHDLVFILDIRGQNVRRMDDIVMPRDPERPKSGRFLDISFDGTGTTLYAWGNRDIYGVLFAYELSATAEKFDLVFKGKYAKNFSGDDVVIIPSSGQLECLVAPDAKTFFVGCVPSDGLEQRTSPDAPPKPTPVLPQHVPDLPQGMNPVAACLFNGSVIMLESHSPRRMMPVQKAGQLCQVPIRKSRKLDFSFSKSPFATLKEKLKVDLNLNVTSKIGFVQQSGGSFAMLVCHSNGKFEFVPLQNRISNSNTL